MKGVGYTDFIAFLVLSSQDIYGTLTQHEERIKLLEEQVENLTRLLEGVDSRGIGFRIPPLIGVNSSANLENRISKDTETLATKSATHTDALNHRRRKGGVSWRYE